MTKMKNRIKNLDGDAIYEEKLAFDNAELGREIEDMKKQITGQ